MRPTLFFYANYYADKEYIGTTKKIKSEIRHFRKVGYCVFYTACLSDGVAIFDDDDNCVDKIKYKFKR